MNGDYRWKRKPGGGRGDTGKTVITAELIEREEKIIIKIGVSEISCEESDRGTA